MNNNLGQKLKSMLGLENVLQGDRVESRNPGYCSDSMKAGIVLLPRSTAQVAEICAFAHDQNIALIPHGGLTGLVDGTASEPGQIIVSFEKMNKILRVDPDQAIVEVEAGATLEAIIEAVDEYGLMLGIDIPSRGSCMAGGLASTNGGGVRVIRYGMARENILGIECVLPNGQIIDSTNTLLKNNTGYDLKHLFIGAEGSLGLITRVVFRLTPKPSSLSTALIACASLENMIKLLTLVRNRLAGNLLSFEAMWPEYYHLTTAQPGFGRKPIEDDYEVYGVVEAGGWGDQIAADSLEAVLAEAFDSGLLEDAALASSEAERQSIWRAREDSDAIEFGFDHCLTYDVGCEIQYLQKLVSKLRENFSSKHPGITLYVFGHLGDGNLHLMLGLGDDEFPGRDPIDRTIYDTLGEFPNSTISAEHGIGLEKKAFLGRSRSDAELDLMKMLKSYIDPKNILNPDKIFSLS